MQAKCHQVADPVPDPALETIAIGEQDQRPRSCVEVLEETRDDWIGVDRDRGWLLAIASMDRSRHQENETNGVCAQHAPHSARAN